MKTGQRSTITNFILQAIIVFFIFIIFLLSYLRKDELESLHITLFIINFLVVTILYLNSKLSEMQKKIYLSTLLVISIELLIFLVQFISYEYSNFLTFIKVCIAISNICILFVVNWSDKKLLRLFGILLSVCGYYMVDDISFYTNSVAAIISSIIFVIVIIAYLDKKIRLVWLLIIIFFITKLFVLYSRTTILALLVILAFELICRIYPKLNNKKNIKFFSYITLLFIPIYTLVYLNIYNNQHKYVDILTFFSNLFSNKAIFTGREVIWQDILNVLSNNMLLGLGNDVYSSNLLYGMGHNLFFSSMLHHGIFGTAILFLFLAFIINTTLKKYNAQSIIIKIGVYSLIVMLVIQLSEGYFMDPYISMILYIPLSLAISLDSNRF